MREGFNQAYAVGKERLFRGLSLRRRVFGLYPIKAEFYDSIYFLYGHPIQMVSFAFEYKLAYSKAGGRVVFALEGLRKGFWFVFWNFAHGV